MKMLVGFELLLNELIYHLERYWFIWQQFSLRFINDKEELLICALIFANKK